MRFADPQLLERMPSEYWQTNCAVAASFLHRDDCARRDRIGVDHIMWGSDYPHLEGTAPFSHEAIRMTFAGVPEPEVRAMLGENAAARLRLRLARLDAARGTVRADGRRRRRRPRHRSPTAPRAWRSATTPRRTSDRFSIAVAS